MGRDPFSLLAVPDCFMTSQQIKIWQWLSWWWWWWCYQVVQRIWKTEVSETRRQEEVTGGCWYQIICFKIIWRCKNYHLSIKFDPCLGPRVLMTIFLFANVPRWMREILEHRKTQEMCNEAVEIEPHSLAFAPDGFKTEDMCNKEVGRNAYTLDNVPDYIMMQKICNEAMHENPAPFFLVPDCSKT